MMNDTLSSHDILLSDCLQTKTDFLLCVICQIAVSTFVNSQQPESYAKFLETMSVSYVTYVSELNWTMVIFQV